MLEKFLSCMERIAMALEMLAGSKREMVAAITEPVEEVVPAPPVEDGQADEQSEPINTVPPVVPPVPPVVPEESTEVEKVELDAEGFPWDGRINPKAKTKVQKTGLWKLIRKIDETSPGLVGLVRGEQVAAGYGKEDESFVPPSTPSAPPVPPAAPEETPELPATTGELNFPNFVSLVTAAGYTVPTIQPFLDKHGIAALPMLAQDLNLMKQVAVEMGVWNDGA